MVNSDPVPRVILQAGSRTGPGAFYTQWVVITLAITERHLSGAGWRLAFRTE